MVQSSIELNTTTCQGTAHRDPLSASAKAALGLETIEGWARPRPRVCTPPHGDLRQVLSPPGLPLLSHNCASRGSWADVARGGAHCPSEAGGCLPSQLTSVQVLPIFPDMGCFDGNVNVGGLRKEKGKHTHPLVTRSQKYRHFKSVCLWVGQ